MGDTSELYGIIPPLVTPTRAGRVDADGLKRLVDHVVTGGVHGVFVAGTTGEFSLLGRRDWGDLVEATVDATARRVPVLVGVTSDSTSGGVELATEAGRLGADYVVATTPSYFRHSQAELIEHYTVLASESPLPVLLYNIPQNTGNTLEPAMVLALSRVPNIVGYKDSAGRLEHMRTLVHDIDDTAFRIFLGSDTLGDVAVSVGTHGTVPSIANLVPDLVVSAWDAAVSGDARMSAELHTRVGLVARIYTAGDDAGAGGFVAALRYAMELIGVPVGDPFPPVAALSESGRQRVAEILRDCSLIGERLAR